MPFFQCCRRLCQTPTLTSGLHPFERFLRRDARRHCRHRQTKSKRSHLVGPCSTNRHILLAYFVRYRETHPFFCICLYWVLLVGDCLIVQFKLPITMARFAAAAAASSWLFAAASLAISVGHHGVHAIEVSDVAPSPENQQPLGTDSIVSIEPNVAGTAGSADG